MSVKKPRAPQVLIVSSDEVLSELLALEAQSCGWYADRRREWSADIGEDDYDAMLLDARDGGSAMAWSTCPTAVMGAGERGALAGESDAVWWQLPIRLSEARDFLCRSLTKSGACANLPLKSEKPLKGVEPCLYWQSAGTVIYRNQRITLTEREWCVLTCLASGNGQVVSRRALQWELGSDGGALSVHICHLRAKLEEPFGIRLIDTVRSEGYRLRIALREYRCENG